MYSVFQYPGTVGSSAGKCPVQWCTVIFSAGQRIGTVRYSRVKWPTVAQYSGVQWDTGWYSSSVQGGGGGQWDTVWYSSSVQWVYSGVTVGYSEYTVDIRQCQSILGNISGF